MRVALIAEESQQLNTHLNLCPNVTKESDILKFSKLINIDEYVQNGQADELLILHTIELIPTQLILDVLTHWIYKVSHNGKIVVVGTDGRIVAKRFGLYRMSLEDFNLVMYGANGAQQCILTIDRVSKFLEKNNFKIMEKRIEDITFIVTGQRL